MENGTIELVRRDTLEKQTVSQEGLVERIEGLMIQEIQENIFRKASDYRESMITKVDTWGRVQACARREGRFHSGALGRDARDRGADQSRNQGYDPLHSCRCSGRRRRLHRQRQAVPPPGAVRPVLLIERLIASLDVSMVRIGEPIRTVSFYSFCVGRLFVCDFFVIFRFADSEKDTSPPVGMSASYSGAGRSFELCPIRGFRAVFVSVSG